MRKNICYVMFLVAVILLTAAVGLSQQNNQDFNQQKIQSSKTSEIANFHDLTFKVSTLKENYLKLEPITLKIEMSNDKNYPVMGHFYVSFSNARTRLLIGTTKENLTETKPKLSMRTVCVKGNNQLISPKERQSSTQTLDSKLEELFPVEGEYYLQLAVKDFTGKQELFSNIIKIKINEPKGKELVAYQYLKGFSANYFSRLSFSIEQSEYFIDTFPDSAYTNQVMFYLANSFLSDKKYENAIKYFEILLNRDFALNDEVLTKLVKVNLEINNEKKAKAYFRILESKFPDSQYIKNIGWHTPFTIDAQDQ